MRKIYTNGNIYTGTNGNAEAFVEEEGKFIYVGNNERALSYKQEDSEIIDLQNKFVTAGFNDSHMHVVEFGDYLEIMHMGDFTGSLKELIILIISKLFSLSRTISSTLILFDTHSSKILFFIDLF